MAENLLPVSSGCRLAPDCFTCPFPDCIAQETDISPQSKRYHRMPAGERKERNALIKKDLDMGMTTNDCKAKYGISDTHICRIRRGVYD
jgi:hypothetical protein